MFPEWLNATWLRLKVLFRRRQLERDLDDETQFHLAMSEQKLVEQGMAADEAHYAALRRFGNVAAVREECRDSWGVRFINELAQDVRFGLRQFRRNPGFTLVAIVILALGIGSSTAIFSVLYAAILHPLPYPDSGRIVMIWRSNRRLSQWGVSGPEYFEWKKENTVFTTLAAARYHNPALTNLGANQRLDGYRVTPGFFKIFGARAAKGRLFEQADQHSGMDHLVVLGSKFHSQVPGSETTKVGGKLTLDQKDYAIVGTVPASFQFPAIFPGLQIQPEAYVSFPVDWLNQGGWAHTSLWVFGKLKPGVTLRQAQAQMSMIASRIAHEHPATNAGVKIRLVPLRKQVHGFLGRIYGFLLAAVGFLLLLACVNVAVLLLAQGTRRQQEIAIRQAVGAGRRRVVAQLLTESILLAVAGGAVGMMLAFWLRDAMVALSPSVLLPKTYPITINGYVLAFALGVSLLTGMLFGLAPALQLTRVNLHALLKEGGLAGDAGKQARRARNTLVVCEVGLGLALLIICGLTVRSMAGILFAKPAFNPRKMVSAYVAFPSFKYHKFKALDASFRNLLGKLDALPGVKSVALEREEGAHVAGANGLTSSTFEASLVMPISMVTPTYFRTVQLPLLRGRLFTAADYKEQPTVAIINRALARDLWPNRDALGKRLTITYPPKWYEVVGIAANNRAWSGGPTFPHLYVPTYNSYMNVWVRTANDAKASVMPVRKLLQKQDKEIGILSIGTEQKLRERGTAPGRYIIAILISLAVIALVLATIGIYAVAAYSVTQRVHEIGIRMSLGAPRGKVLLLMMRQGAVLSLSGIALGILLAPALRQVMGSFLRGTAKHGDVSTYVAVSALFLLVTLLASYIPARRATKIDPAKALRCE